MKRGTPDHPKMKRLARALNINRAWAVGIMESLWHWTAKFAPRGDIGKYQDSDIADGCFWDQDPKTLLDALISTGWVDENSEHRLLVHHWREHCEDSVRKYMTRNNIPFIKDMSGHFTDKSGHFTDTSDEIVPDAAMVQAMAKAGQGGLGENDVTPCNGQSVTKLQGLLNSMFGRKESSRWNYQEEAASAEVSRRPEWEQEFGEISAYFQRCEKKYFPRSVFSLLDKWNQTLDAARRPKERTADEERALSKLVPNLPRNMMDENSY